MNTIKFVNNYLANNASLDIATKIAKLRRDLYSHGICWTDSVSGNFTDDSFRVILYIKSNTDNVDFSNMMVNECNGMVLEYQRDNNHGRFVPLVVPTPNFNKNKVSMGQINKYYRSGQYNVYEVLDATIINLYYYDNQWRISTTKGYDVGNYEFAEGLTYLEVFNKIIRDGYHNFHFDNLPKNHCYSFALRYDQYHLFDETKHIYSKNIMKSYMYTLRVVDLNKMKSTSEVFVGIPYQMPVNIKSAKNVSTLIDYAKHAYNKYMKAYSTNQYRYKPLYGYILRASHSTVSVGYKNILITSTLFKVIKNGLYRNRAATTNEIIAKMFVSKDKDKNKVLFQQFTPQFNKLEAVVSHVCEDTLAVLSGKDHLSTYQLVKEFSTKLGEDMIRDGLVVSSTLHISVVYDYLHSIDYVQFIESLIDA